jgi:hypothetical protein
MDNIDRSFESALEAVLASGRSHTELGVGREALLKKLVNIGYENQFSPEDRVKARRDIKDSLNQFLSSKEGEEQ